MGSVGSTQSDFVENATRSFLEYYGFSQPKGNEQALLKESETADVPRLIEIAREVGSDAFLGFANNMDKSVRVSNITPSQIEEIRDNPQSIQSLRNGIKSVIGASDRYRERATSIESNFRDIVAHNVGKGPEILAGNPKPIGIESSLGLSGWNLVVQYTKTRADGSTYVTTERVSIPEEYMRNR